MKELPMVLYTECYVVFDGISSPICVLRFRIVPNASYRLRYS